MSILKKVLNAVRKIFGGSSKKKRGTSKRSPKTTRTSKRRIKASASRKTTTRIIGKRKPAKGPKTRPETSKSRSAASIKPKVTPDKKIKSVSYVLVGEITHYFDKIKVCVVRVDHGEVKKGDRLLIEGNKGSLIQIVSSMQIENEDVAFARKGQVIGLKVKKAVHVGDLVKKL